VWNNTLVLSLPASRPCQGAAQLVKPAVLQLSLLLRQRGYLHSRQVLNPTTVIVALICLRARVSGVRTRAIHVLHGAATWMDVCLTAKWVLLCPSAPA
jgi:hypothetical protein